MKLIIFLISIFFLFFLKKEDDCSLVRNHMNEQQTAWNNGNIEKFMGYYWNNDSLKFIGSKGLTYGWQKTLANYKKSYPNKEAMGELLFTIIEVTELSSKSIYVIGKWELKKEKPSGGHFTLLWRKINGQWLIVSDHSS